MLSTSKAKKWNTFQNNFKYLKEYSKKFRKKLIGKREEEFYGFPWKFLAGFKNAKILRSKLVVEESYDNIIKLINSLRFVNT